MTKETLEKYFKLKEKERTLQEKISELREEIIGDLKDSNAKALEVEGYRAIWSDKIRESFQLKEARGVINESILAPFIKVSNYPSLRVSKVK
jgi:hypothetical protein